MTLTPSPSVLALADSDSYVKWAAGTLDHLPPGWARRLVVVRSPIRPSRAQIAAAVAGTGSQLATPPVLTAGRIAQYVERTRPDVVLAACTGPVVDVLIRDFLRHVEPRPVFVSGLPGISVPATAAAWRNRSAVDLFVLHSRREVRDFTLLGEELGVRGRVGLARLPFLDTLAPLDALLPSGLGPARRSAG